MSFRISSNAKYGDIDAAFNDAFKYSQEFALENQQKQDAIVRQRLGEWMQEHGVKFQESPQCCTVECTQKSCTHKITCDCTSKVQHAFGDIFVCTHHSRVHWCGRDPKHPLTQETREGLVCLYSGRHLGLEMTAGPNEHVYDKHQYGKVESSCTTGDDENDTNAIDYSAVEVKRGRRQRRQEEMLEVVDIRQLTHATLRRLFDADNRKKRVAEIIEHAKKEAQNKMKAYVRKQRDQRYYPVFQEMERIAMCAFAKRARPESATAQPEYISWATDLISRMWHELIVGNENLAATNKGTNIKGCKIPFIFGVLHYMGDNAGLPFYRSHIIYYNQQLENYMPEAEDLEELGYDETAQSKGWRLLREAAHTTIERQAREIMEDSRGTTLEQARGKAARLISQRIYFPDGSNNSSMCQLVQTPKRRRK
jgi:hypothetical protein